MNSMNNELSDIDPSLAAIDRSLSELAAADRASARAGMEGRVAAATEGGLRFGRPSLRLAGSPAAARRRVLTPMKLAAGLGIAVVIGSVFLAQRPAAVPSLPIAAEAQSVEQDLAEWLAISGGATDDLATQISRLEADTSSVLDNFSGSGTSMDGSGEEGSL